MLELELFSFLLYLGHEGVGCNHVSVFFIYNLIYCNWWTLIFCDCYQNLLEERLMQRLLA